MKFCSILILAIISLTFSNCAINSGLGIGANNEFILGGNPNNGFKAKVENDGQTSVSIQELKSNGSLVDLGLLEPGESVRAKFNNSSAAIFKNENDEPASLKVRVTGDTNLGMSYKK